MAPAALSLSYTVMNLLLISYNQNKSKTLDLLDLLIVA